jgi:hypothetical protein
MPFIIATKLQQRQSIKVVFGSALWTCFCFQKAKAEPKGFSFSAAALKKLLFYSTNLKADCTLLLQLFRICENYTPTIGHIYTFQFFFIYKKNKDFHI